MRNIFKGLVISLLFIPIISYAIWQVADPLRGTKQQYAITPKLGKTDYPQSYYSNKQVTLKIKKGLLKTNVMNFAKHNDWKVIWRVQKKYYVLVRTEFSGPNFSTTLNRLLEHYPVKAIYRYRTSTVMIVS